MPRPILLFTGQWSDLPLEQLALKVSAWGYQGLELCCWGDHFEVQRALSSDEYGSGQLELLARHDLQLGALACHRVSQAVCDRVEPRHRRILPDYVWGDGDPEGVSQRAAAELLATIQAAAQLGATTVTGFSGSSLWPAVMGYPPANAEEVQEGLRHFAENFAPILDACGEAGIRYALEVHPGQIAFDLYSAEMALDAVDGRAELGFLFDPSHFLWQGVDPVEFVRRFPDRIYHVHVKDVALMLNGRTGVLNAYQAHGDPRRGWEPRCPGHGGIDWESVMRALNAVHYDGPLSIEISDPGMARDHAAAAALAFVKNLDFDPPDR